MKMIGNVSDWLSYAGGALIKVADSAGSTVHDKIIFSETKTQSFYSWYAAMSCGDPTNHALGIKYGPTPGVIIGP